MGIITLGIGTPADITDFVLFGLSVNPEVRDAETVQVLGVYDGSALLESTYDSDAAVVSTYDESVALVGGV